jgi:hypothetical protein
MECLEKVRSQLLSLRQLRRGRLFSARGCWVLSPVLAAISDLGSDFYSAESTHSSPNGSILSRSLHFANSLRFSKFECFELLMNSDEMEFCRSSRAGKSAHSFPPNVRRRAINALIHRPESCSVLRCLGCCRLYLMSFTAPMRDFHF